MRMIPYPSERSESSYQTHMPPNPPPPTTITGGPARNHHLRDAVQEVSLPNNNHNNGDEKSSEKGSGRTLTTLKQFPGVRMRRRGRWSAEIRDPFKRRKVWLGTFRTPEQASKAFEAKKLEFCGRQQAQITGMDRARPGCGSGTDTSSQSGEQSVAGLNLESILIDNNGFLLGQFSNLDDDLSISD